jgi:oligopeptide/dipeptide ABC transporter ATP-binding protein
LQRGEILGLVGESGSGKTTVAMGILRLLQTPGRVLGGRALLDGTDLFALEGEQLRQWRWRKLALIPQGAMNSLNPVMRVKDQIADAIVTHEGKQSNQAIASRIGKLLELVQLPPHVSRMYAHELSGGMKQRVCIAMAIALNPPLIIADEPTSALDVVVQRAVARTLLEIKQRLDISLVLIGHDMGLMAQMADRVAVMYAGRLVEIGPVRAIFHQPLHPYTQRLIESIPSVKKRQRLQVTEGLTHDLRQRPAGCIYQSRCPQVMDHCRTQDPPLRDLRPQHQTACHLYQQRDGRMVNVSNGSAIEDGRNQP